MKNEQMKKSNEEIVIEEENSEEQVVEERRYWNVFDEIEKVGHDEDFVPAVTPEFCRTDAPAGSRISVYTPDGRRVPTTGLSAGTYIVKINDQTFKILAR